MDPGEIELAAGRELIPMHGRLDRLSHQRAGVRGGIDGQFTLPAEDIEPAGVIAVIVSEHHGGEGVGIDFELFKSEAELTSGKACVDQDANVIPADQGTVARATATENCQFQHRDELR